MLCPSESLPRIAASATLGQRRCCIAAENTTKTIRTCGVPQVRCSACQGHLGHVFRDGPPPTNLRCVDTAGPC